jgi:hypothetical protein
LTFRDLARRFRHLRNGVSKAAHQRYPE